MATAGSGPCRLGTGCLHDAKPASFTGGVEASRRYRASVGVVESSCPSAVERGKRSWFRAADRRDTSPAPQVGRNVGPGRAGDHYRSSRLQWGSGTRSYARRSPMTSRRRRQWKAGSLRSRRLIGFDQRCRAGLERDIRRVIGAVRDAVLPGRKSRSGRCGWGRPATKSPKRSLCSRGRNDFSSAVTYRDFQSIVVLII